MTENLEWAKALKPGDEVALSVGSSIWSAPYEILTLLRTTATQFVFKRGAVELRVRKDTLVPPKMYRPIEPVTPEIREANARYRMARDLEGLRAEEIRKFPMEYITAMHAALTASRAIVKGGA